jgi:hypothetical protein
VSISHNAPAIATKYRSAAAAIKAAVSSELTDLVGEVAARMRIKAPKDLTVLTNSVKQTKLGPFEWFVEPTADYALWVEKGRKPGRGLPLFAAGLPVVEWLRRRLVGAALAENPKFRKARKGSKREQLFEEALKVRYLAFSRHVKAHGLKAHPFVKPTANEFRSVVPSRLVAAVHRGAAAFKGQTS